MNQTTVSATYWLDTTMEADKAADIIAGEQSSGTFVPIPGESEELKAKAGAHYEILEESVPGRTSLIEPSYGFERPVRRYRLRLSWPFHNIGPSLPQLLATIAGNLYELKHVIALRLDDFDLPEQFAAAYPGPAFGVDGTRELNGVRGRPLIGTIIKPSIGLSAQDTASLVELLCQSGVDFIKDDELQASGASCPFEERARSVMDVINRYTERTGRKVMYAFNLTGELDDMKRRHDLVESLGGSCVMLSLNSVGLTGFSAFRAHARLPIHAHRNGWGYLSRGWSYVAWQKLWRLAGADHMHVNGLRNKFQETDESVARSAKACLTPLFDNKPCLVMPVFSSGQSAKQAPGTYKVLGGSDALYLAGGGIMGHPGGVAAGVLSIKQAWDAAMNDIPLSIAAKDHRELREALEVFGH